ncbi:hypothetical protein PV_017 (endogenous virus) [Gutovirus Vc1]|uniref:Uncharacterized protein n=1 Tax=Vibrio phage Vc1 TaxID=1480731 RepID=X2KT26_9CAUD|nr:acetyl-CoA acetyltransferase [Vibrio phage Vc1]AHN84668.1 hypothetical protein PV_017 [Vibrio phage Vc1]
MATPLTGDIKNRVEVDKKGVTLHNMPKVLIADLSDKANIVNDKAQSGKRLGAMLVGYTGNTAAALMVAAGSGDTDAWVTVKDIVGTTADITPA